MSRLYFTFKTGTLSPEYTGDELAVEIDKIFYLTQQQTQPQNYTQTFVPVSQVTIETKYTSSISAQSSVKPVNVGRYDYYITLRCTINGTNYIGFSSSNYYSENSRPAGIADFNSIATDDYAAVPEKNTLYPLIVKPCPVLIEFTTTERTYDGSPEWPTYKVKIVKTSQYKDNIPLKLSYSYTGTPWWKSGDYATVLSDSGSIDTTSGAEPIISAIPPIDVGSYEMEASIADFNYTGSAKITYRINAKSENTINEKTGLTDTQEYESKLNLLSENTRTDLTSKQFLTSATMKILDDVDVINLDKITSLADCAKNLPQKLLIAASKKVMQLVLNYVPGLGIIQLLTSALKLVQQVQEVLALIEEIKKNPLTFLDAVLEGSGVYDKIGDAIDNTVSNISKNFPGVGNALSIANNAVNGLVDFCETENFDSLGNIIPKSTKADPLKKPEDVKGFTPASLRQPIEQKLDYDAFLYEIRDITAKDQSKIDELSKLTDKTRLNEYLSMITTVNELAYKFHDSVAAKATAKGLLDVAVVSSGGSSGGSAKLDSIISSLGGTLNTANSFVELGGGNTVPTNSTTNSMNSTLGGIASSLDGVTGSIGSVATFASGGSTFTELVSDFTAGLSQAANSVSISSDVSMINFEIKKALERNPKWSPSTVTEFKSKMNKVKDCISSNKNAILNNPLFAKNASTESLPASSNITGISSIDNSNTTSGASLASLKNESEKTQFARMKNLVLSSSLNGYKPSDGDKYGITSGSSDEWALFFTKLGVKESGLKNGIVGDVGKFVGNSNGLYQLSPLDYSNYASYFRSAGIQNGTTLNGKPAFSTAQLQDPDINSKAALIIAERLIKANDAIGSDSSTGMAKYWGPLRRGWTPSNMS